MRDGLARSLVVDDRALLYQTTVTDPDRGFVLVSDFAVDPARPVLLMRTRGRFRRYSARVPGRLASVRVPP